MSLAEEIPDLPDEYLAEIGRVNVRWAILESILDINLIRLLGKDVLEGRSLVVFNHMAFPQKIDILGALIHEIKESKYCGFEGYPKVESLLKQAQEKRNSLVHAKYSYLNGRVEMSRITSRGRLKMTTKLVDLGDIKATSELICKARNELHLMVTKALDRPRKQDNI